MADSYTREQCIKIISCFQKHSWSAVVSYELHGILMGLTLLYLFSWLRRKEWREREREKERERERERESNFFDPHESQMDLCNELCSPILSDKQLLHWTLQTVQPNFFVPAMLLGTIDFYHFIPLSLVPFYTAFSLTLPGGHMVSRCCLLFSHTFHLIRMKFDVVMMQFKLNILRLLLSKIYWNKGNICRFIDCFKKL